MPLLAPSTTPMISYGHDHKGVSDHYRHAYAHPHHIQVVPFAALPKPPASTLLYDRVYNDDRMIGLKCNLRNLLKKNKLSKMPMGFPFRCVHDGHGGWVISHGSYEFWEKVCFSDQHARVQYATFVYVAPDLHSKHAPRVMTWRIYIPTRQSSTSKSDGPQRVSIAHVQIDPIVMETPFGLDLMTNPCIMLEALALSIELGILVTVQMSNHKTRMIYPSKQGICYESGEIVFVTTDNNGRSEVAFVFEP